MRTPANPFTDPGQIRGSLYASVDRQARRTSALHRARVSGRHAAEVIADLAAAAAVTSAPVIADIGCGRGTTTRLLAERLPQAWTIAIDLSAALLAAARTRLPSAVRAGTARADFHQLPLRDGACDLAVAAFCLYHSRSPGRGIAEITRCLGPDATAIIAVKSADSYRELDLLMADSGLAPDAADRPSLYATAHSGNIEHLTDASLDVREVIHDTHAFAFPALADLAEYLATSPKYGLPASLTGDAARLAAKLCRRLPDEPFTMTSVVTYVVAQRTTAT
ncbi:MAG TPA: methyltransferase domain-containing protein [Streptosporangiaceae bacterium]|jgi:SAM-dependent methyltransferase